MLRKSLTLIAATLISGASGVAVADDYWNYAYKDFEITTVESAGRALSLAHSVARFDTALTSIMQLSESRVRTHIYELPHKETSQFLGEGYESFYHSTGYEVIVVTEQAARNSNRWHGALFGYTGSVLISGRLLRCPYWFRIGVPEVFANTEFEVEQIKTGWVPAGYSRTLTLSNLIPTRVLLRMQGGDPQLQNLEYRRVFEAESWFLAYEILVRGKLKAEFSQYLGLLRDGKSEEDAFAASFKLSHEDLDKELLKAMREPAYSFTVKVPREPTEHSDPRRLTESEAKARLADLNLRFGHRADALQLATEAVREDAGDELGLSVAARANLRDGNFGAALPPVEKLDALPAVSAAGRTDAGDVLAALADAVASKKASIGVDAETLSHRSKDEYERAISLDSDYLRAWAGLAYLYGLRHDSAAAQVFSKRAHAVMEKHTENGALARALATMCSRTGQVSDAAFFGQLWVNNAPSETDRERAVSFVAQIQAH